MLRSHAPSWALLSVLGVPGWGPLHLLLKRGADPDRIGGRLRRSLAQAGLPLSGRQVPAGQLLAALLRSQRDLDPLTALAEGALLARLRYRHRLVCREGNLTIRSWERRSGRGRCDWCCLGPGQGLEEFLQSPRQGSEAWRPAATIRGPRSCKELASTT